MQKKNNTSKRISDSDIFPIIMKLVKDWGLTVLLVFAIVITQKYFIQLVVVSGSSMQPAYNHRDMLLINKTPSSTNDLSRYDVIVFSNSDSDEKILIKRVIGLSGEIVQIIDSDIYINNEKIEDNYKKEALWDSGIANNQIVLKEDEYFVLGDNRNNSNDSRFFGPIKRDCIMGKVIKGK